MLEHFSRSNFNEFVYEYYDFGKDLAKRVLKPSIQKLGIQKAYSKVFNPVTDWSRFEEFFMTYELLKHHVNDGDTILDIGSPKLFSIWFATKKHVNIKCTDLWEYAVLEYSHFWDAIKHEQKSQVWFETADLLDLKYNNEEFDAIFSISTIEHAFDPNWKKTISKNLARVLKNNKIAIITTPFGSKSVNQYKNRMEYSPTLAEKTNNFFMRIINEDDLKEFVKSAEEYDLYLEECYTLNSNANKLSIFIRLLPVHLNVLFGFMKPKFAIQNFSIKSGIHCAEKEKYDTKWSPDMITSDIVLVFRKKKTK